MSFLKVLLFLLFLTVMPFLTARPISLVTMAHTVTELGVNSFVSSSKIWSIQLNASVAVSFAIDWNVEEDLFSFYIILRSFFLDFLHKINFSSKKSEYNQFYTYIDGCLLKLWEISITQSQSESVF